MIVFSPAYDEQTRACSRLAVQVADSVPGTHLNAELATRSGLLEVLRKEDSCMIFSHGAPELICGQDDEPALFPIDLRYITHKAPIYAYACYSAMFGQNTADRKRLWWGYDMAMVPPPFGVLSSEDIVGVFRYVAHRFSACESTEHVQELIEELKELCQGRVATYRRRGSVQMTSMVFFMQLWTRLRVWTPWSSKPISHAEAWTGELDAAI